jgi:hypothetical protein
MEDKKLQEKLHHSFSDQEEDYHAAYPDVRYPYLTGIMAAFFGRDRGKFIFGGIAVLLIVGAIWAGYTYHWHFSQ